MRTFYFLLIVLVLGLCCYNCNSENQEKKIENQELVLGERIDGPANVRDSINGEGIFSIEDNQLVECSEIKNNWYYIGLAIPLTEEQFREGKIKAGEKIYDGNQLICTIFKDTYFLMSSINENKESNVKYFGIIDGYTFKDNIKETSIIERELEKILNSNKKLTKELFNEHLQNFRYEKGGLSIEGYEKVEQFLVYGIWIEDPSPIDRVRLIFESNELIAVIHERELKMNGKKSYELVRGLEILIIKEFSNSKLEKFIESNKKSYWGVG